MKSTPGWSQVAAAAQGAEIDRIETDRASISIVDYLFEGQARIILKDQRTLPAQVFGRYDDRRAKVERIVLDSDIQ